MEPITTELRELAQDMNWTEIIDHIHARNVLDGDWLDSWHKAFDARCDAIDAVHARLEQENDELGKTVYDMRREFDEWKHSLDTGWIRLPVDADGEPWHIGDVTENGVTVNAMRLGSRGWIFLCQNDIDPSIHRHYHAPTVEDVLREFALAVCKDDALTIRKDVVDEYAAKLQLKEDA